MTMTSLWSRVADMKGCDITSDETLCDFNYEDCGCDEEQRYGDDDDNDNTDVNDKDADQVVPVFLGKHECAEACYGEECDGDDDDDEDKHDDDDDTRVDLTDDMFNRLLNNVYNTYGPVPFDTEDEWMQIMKDNTVTETRLKRVSVIKRTADGNTAPIEIFEEVPAEDDAVSDDEDDA